MAPLSYRRHRFPPEIIQHAIWLYLRFILSYCDVEELLVGGASTSRFASLPAEARAVASSRVGGALRRRLRVKSSHSDSGHRRLNPPKAAITRSLWWRRSQPRKRSVRCCSDVARPRHTAIAETALHAIESQKAVE